MPMPPILESDNTLPAVVMGYVSVRSKGGTSFLDAGDLADPEPFHGSRADATKATQAIEKAGLEIVAESGLGMSVAGPPGAYEELTGGTLAAVERLMHTRLGRVEYVTHLDVVGSGQPEALGVGDGRPAAIEGVVLERPRAPLQVFPAPMPPSVPRFHLRVPDDVATILGAAEAHRRGQRGAGVTVAMVDSGWFRHPFFTAHGYSVESPVTVVPGTNPARDPHGHGTGESANVFAIAPEAVLRPFRAANDRGDLVGAVAGFVRAKQGRPDVLTNSWGGDYDRPGAGRAGPGRPGADPRDPGRRSAQGIVVVFAAGNGSFGAEAQVPGVIAAGGVFANAGLDLQASDYASGYHSDWFGGVDVPTVSRPRRDATASLLHHVADPAGLPDRRRARRAPAAATRPTAPARTTAGRCSRAPRRRPRRSPAPRRCCAGSARTRHRRRSPRALSGTAERRPRGALPPALRQPRRAGPRPGHRLRADRRVRGRGRDLS